MCLDKDLPEKEREVSCWRPISGDHDAEVCVCVITKGFENEYRKRLLLKNAIVLAVFLDEPGRAQTFAVL